MQQIHTGGMSFEAHPLPLLAYMGTALSISRAGDKIFFIRCEDPLMCAGKCLSESAKLMLNRRVQLFAAKALTAAALLSLRLRCQRRLRQLRLRAELPRSRSCRLRSQKRPSG